MTNVCKQRLFCLVKQIYGYFWFALKKAKDGWPAGCQHAETNSFLSSELKIHPGREVSAPPASVQSKAIEGQSVGSQGSIFTSYDSWRTWMCGYFWNSLTMNFGWLHSRTMGLICNKMMFWPSAKEGHFPPIRACIIIPRQQKLWCWKERRKLLWHDKLGCSGLAAKRTPHFSLILLCNQTTGELAKFPCSSLALTSKWGHSLHGECWQVLTFLSVLKLETFLKNNHLPFITLGRWAGEERLQFALRGAWVALKTSDWSQIMWNKGRILGF